MADYRMHRNDYGTHWLLGKPYAYAVEGGRLTLHPVEPDFEDARV